MHLKHIKSLKFYRTILGKGIQNFLLHSAVLFKICKEMKLHKCNE